MREYIGVLVTNYRLGTAPLASALTAAGSGGTIFPSHGVQQSEWFAQALPAGSPGRMWIDPAVVVFQCASRACSSATFAGMLADCTPRSVQNTRPAAAAAVGLGAAAVAGMRRWGGVTRSCISRGSLTTS